MNKDYYYVIMTQKDLLLNQVIEEVFREKVSYYVAQGKEIDFWTLISPKFIEEEQLNVKIRKTRFFVDQKDKIVMDWSSGNTTEFYAALVSTNEEYIRWLKLRFGYFEDIDDLTNKTIPQVASDGVCGTLHIDEKKPLSSVLEQNCFKLHSNVSDHTCFNKLEGFYM